MNDAKAAEPKVSLPDHANSLIEATEHLNKRIGTLRDQLGDLRGRLTPVMMPQSDENEAYETKWVSDVPLSQQVHQSAYAVAECCEVVEDVLDRLGL